MQRLLTLLACLCCCGLPGQNLVPNASFEAFHQCPPYPGQIHEAVAWDSPNNQTTDFFHRCAPAADGAGVPANLLGFQEPRTGDGYAGVRTWLPIISGNPVYREYLAAALLSPLQAHVRYEVRFHVSVAEASSYYSDDLGLYFSTEPFDQLDRYPFPAHIRQPEGRLLEDTESWTEVSGTYRASGGEQYLIIGNFLDDHTMTRRPANDQEPVVYYYIDDVWVAPCPAPEPLTTTVDTALCAGGQLLLSGAPDARRYQWENGARQEMRFVDQPGTYTVASEFLCYTLTKRYIVKPADCDCGLNPPTLLRTDQAGGRLPLRPRAPVLTSEITLFAADGRQVIRANNQPEIAIAELPGGLYLLEAELQCRGANGQITRRTQREKIILVRR